MKTFNLQLNTMTRVNKQNHHIYHNIIFLFPLAIIPVPMLPSQEEENENGINWNCHERKAETWSYNHAKSHAVDLYIRSNSMKFGDL